MKFIIQRKLDTRLEARSFLERLVTQSDQQMMWADMKAACAEYGRKMRLTAEEHTALLRPLEEFYERLTAVLPTLSEESRMLFAQIPAAQISLAHAMELTAEYLTRCSAPEEERQRFCMDLLSKFLQPEFYDGNRESLNSAEDFLYSIDRLGMSDAEKYRCLRAGLDFEAVYARVDAVLLQVRALADQQQSALQPLVDRWLAHYENRSDDQIESEIRALGIQLDGADCVLQPCCMRFAEVSLQTLATDITCGRTHNGLTIGVLVDEAARRAAAERGNLPALAEDLKALADPTRMSILAALSDGEKYAQELTQLANLTPATISYHMSGLIGHDLISAEKRGTRLYYTLRREKIKRIAEALEAL